MSDVSLAGKNFYNYVFFSFESCYNKNQSGSVSNKIFAKFSINHQLYNIKITTNQAFT